ncbi:unnamed protein product, partial [Discosporangium mesarthrocarpum]
MAFGECVKEILFLRNVFDFFQLLSAVRNQQMVVYEDNMGAINFADNLSISAMSNHIDVRHHFLRQLVDDEVTELVATPSTAQHADIPTKSLGERMF